jgi:hypothetical protein
MESRYESLALFSPAIFHTYHLHKLFNYFLDLVMEYDYQCEILVGSHTPPPSLGDGTGISNQVADEAEAGTWTGGAAQTCYHPRDGDTSPNLFVPYRTDTGGQQGAIRASCGIFPPSVATHLSEVFKNTLSTKRWFMDYTSERRGDLSEWVVKAVHVLPDTPVPMTFAPGSNFRPGTGVILRHSTRSQNPHASDQVTDGDLETRSAVFVLEFRPDWRVDS